MVNQDVFAFSNVKSKENVVVQPKHNLIGLSAEDAVDLVSESD